MSNAPDAERQLLRHALATIAYRGAKPLRDAPANFGTLEIPNNDLFDWALSISKGQTAWNDSTPQDWSSEVARFFHGIKSLDDFLASGETLHESPTKLLQGPIADALSHIGQLALLRRLSGHPIKGENYYKAHITAGQVGPEQPAPRREFD